mgnify:FL=1
MIQFLFIWVKWSDIRDYRELGTDIADMTGVSKKSFYEKLVRTFGFLWSNFKKMLIIPIVVIVFINFVVSLVLGGILSIIF